MTTKRDFWLGLLALGAAAMALVAPASAQSTLNGRVLGASAPIANAVVTLWTASAGAPGAIGPDANRCRWPLRAQRTRRPRQDAILYLVAKGGTPKAAANKGWRNDAIALMALLGTSLPKTVTVNELTTVASAFTAARFINGEAISGNPLGLRIAAGNAPNLVDPATGGWGKVLMDPLNSTQTTTLANLNTLGSLITAFFTVANDDWRARFLKAATPTGGVTPKNTLEAMAGIARAPWAAPKELYALFDEAYPQPKDRLRGAVRPSCRISPTFRTTSPSRCVSRAAAIYANGRFMFDAEGNLWSGQNWMPGSQSGVNQEHRWRRDQVQPQRNPALARRSPASSAWD